MGANEGIAIVLGLLIIGVVYFLVKAVGRRSGVGGSNRDDGTNIRDR